MSCRPISQFCPRIQRKTKLRGCPWGRARFISFLRQSSRILHIGGFQGGRFSYKRNRARCDGERKFHRERVLCTTPCSSAGSKTRVICIQRQKGRSLRFPLGGRIVGRLSIELIREVDVGVRGCIGFENTSLSLCISSLPKFRKSRCAFNRPSHSHASFEPNLATINLGSANIWGSTCLRPTSV